ncbi:MAG: delta-60 repeat domain-containing protein [Verrucomicrobiota bacterium]
MINCLYSNTQAHPSAYRSGIGCQHDGFPPLVETIHLKVFHRWHGLICQLILFVFTFVFLQSSLAQPGAPDTAFLPPLSPYSTVYAAVQRPDGRVLAATANGLILLNTDGSIVSGFATNALTALPLGYYKSNITSTVSLALQSDGKAIVVMNGPEDGILRVTTNGTLDASCIFMNTNDLYSTPQPIVLPSGKVLLYNRDSSTCFRCLLNGKLYNGIVRFNSDLTFDSSFNLGGIGPNNLVNSVSPQSDGKLIIGGRFTSYNGVKRVGIARLNEDGTLDLTYDPARTLFPAVLPFFVASQPQNRTIILAHANIPYLSSAYAIRLNQDGSLDSTFNQVELQIFEKDGPSLSYHHNILTAQDGSIFFVGAFALANGFPVFKIARTLPDGVVDTNYVAANFENSLYGSSLQTDGKLLLCGTIIGVGNVPVKNLARLQGVSAGYTRFSAPSLSRARQFSTTLNVTVGQRLYIESSSNLVNWAAETSLVPASTSVTYTNTLNPNSPPNNFFRGVSK